LFFTIHKEEKPRTVFYNEEAWRISSQTASPLRNGRSSSPDIGYLCSEWKGLFEKKTNGQNGSDEDRYGPILIDTVQSHREKYAVKGILLSGGPGQKGRRDLTFFSWKAWSQIACTLHRTSDDSISIAATGDRPSAY